MLVNFTVDALSPLISYIGGGWNPITNDTDSLLASYDNGTAVGTSQTGNYWTFEFYGTGVWYVRFRNARL